MIEECNFKYDRELDSYTTKQKWKHCYLKDSNCDGKDNCILYQIYKQNLVDDSICYKNRTPIDEISPRDVDYDTLNPKKYDNSWLKEDEDIGVTNHNFPTDELEAKKKTTKEGTKSKWRSRK